MVSALRITIAWALGGRGPLLGRAGKISSMEMRASLTRGVDNRVREKRHAVTVIRPHRFLPHPI
jgi:hypothetical protein